MGENSIKGIMDVTMEKIRAMVDADTIIGNPFVVGNITVLPVSKVSFGLATGGSDFPSKQGNLQLFGGGGGAGVSISPVAFIVINDSDVKLLQIDKNVTAAEKAVALMPELFDKITALFKKDKKQEQSEQSTAN